MKLLTPYDLSGTQLKNRIVMAPMTRCRALGNIPNELMATYYQQRAGAGLIITEGTSPSPNGLGYARIPGAYSDDQIAGWKQIADKVHEAEGKIFVQLMHTGRIAAKPNLPEGATAVAPSAIQAAGEMYCDGIGMVAHDVPSALTEEQVLATIEEYANAAERLVKEAGVDGVELHGANGYLINQFINPRSNQRLDGYGGTIENRARFVIEVIEAVAHRIGAHRVGIRLSPYGVYNDMAGYHDEVIPMFTHLAGAFQKIGMAYIHVVRQPVNPDAPTAMTDILLIIKENFRGTVITGGDVNSLEKGESILDQGFDLTYVGRPFISNPDLVDKLKHESELVAPIPELFYSAEADGYTTY